MAEEFTAKFKVDITDLKKNISDAAKSIKEANATFKAQTAGMDRWSDNADGLSKKLDQLDTVLQNQKKILASYREELKKQQEAAKENGKRADELRAKMKELADQGVSKTSEEYQKYKNALRNVTKEQENNEKATDDLKITILNQEAAVKSTERDIRHYKQSLDNLDNSTEEVTKDTKKADEGFTILKGTLANLAAEGIKKAISGLKNLGKAAIEAYKDFDTGADNIIKSTGATGEAAKDLQKTYKNVTQKVVGNLDEIGSTLGELNTRFGFTDETLEDATEAFTKFADVTGTDATSAVQSVSRIMEKAKVPAENYGDLLDTLAKAAQASGISVDEMADLIDKAGTDMHGLGFDTKETIALLATFEKSGVNTNTVLGGMRKAFQKWSKQGKDSRKEFERAIKVIKNTPNDTKAAQKAIEIFGSKAGPELAKSIKDGKLEYGDFLDTLKTSAGTVEKTYEATQDGFDKVKLVIQGAKSEIGNYVSELADKYAPQIEAFAKKVVEGIKTAVTWIAGNSEKIAAFAGVVATAFAVKKIADFVTTVKKVGGALGDVVSAVKGVSGVLGKLDFASLLNPLGLVIAAVGGLSAAFIAAREEIEKEIQAQYGLTEQQKKTIEAAENIKTSYDEMDKTRNNSMGVIDAEYKHLDDLKEEYNKLLDKNGKVKEGYENRAKFIENEFCRVLGIEQEELEKIIEKNKGLGDSIDEVITKKKGEAILAANEAAYAEALQKTDEALTVLVGSQTTLDEAEANYQKTLEETRKERDKISTAMLHASGNLDQYHYQLGQLDKKEQTAKKAVEDARKAVEDADAAYVGYTNTISNYEGLSEAIIGGEAKSIDEAMTNIQNSFIKAENGSKSSLQRQYDDAVKKYENLKTAADKGMGNVTAAAVAQAEKMVTKSKAELAKYEEAHKTSFNAVLTEAGKTKEEMEKTALASGMAFGDQLGSEKVLQNAKTGSKSLLDAATSGLSDVGQFINNGVNAAAGFIQGMLSKAGEVWQAASNLSKTGVAGGKAGQHSKSPSKDWEDDVGEMAGEGYIVGLAKMVRPAIKAAKKFTEEAVDAAAGIVPKVSGGNVFSGLGANLAGSVVGAARITSGATGTFGGSSVTNVGGANYTYNQTINSPKQLSRIEIYRQTRNLLELSKMGA